MITSDKKETSLRSTKIVYGGISFNVASISKYEIYSAPRITPWIRV
jgi:hypothetical protein